ncbi:AraC family transcriptional regulator [Microvirga sp. STS02]|uniref:AraC family transcriptional regulator n=1 Tax=Hymenobacter negativus TaxID=2795026 RepID=UPI0018DB4731|nr:MULTISPECIES: AraC family transcriptional regulator [Bacteria]MBH8569939.1 AraC family transcriptional regulator [Hymenobacter negativus]MBR7209678.1 AraC family transcriptional regulator [Microvirga sp. STS02]
MPPDTLAVSSLNMLLWVAGQHGADVPALSQAIGFDPATTAGPDARVPIATIQRLWPLVMDATRDPYFDLHLGGYINFATAGTLAYVLMHAPTVGAAITQLCRYQDVACQGVRTFQTPAPEWPGGIWLTLELTSPAIVHPQYVLNSELSVYLAAFATLTGQLVAPQAVRLAYPRPADTREHEAAFGTANLEFDTPLTQVAFDAAALALPVLHANPALFPLFEQHAAALLAQLPTHQPPTLAERVRGEIVRQLKGELPTLTTVAAQLCLGVRTLQLKLKEAGHTYQQLLDNVRSDLAQRHLREPHLSITDVAFLLGYSEPSVFVRSFKKWTGQTPGAFRR